MYVNIYPDAHMHIASSHHFIPLEKTRLEEDRFAFLCISAEVSTNLRASNYDIKHTERSTVKVTAGRIIPALATTTAMICGLVDVEFLKLVLGTESMDGSNRLYQFYAD